MEAEIAVGVNEEPPFRWKVEWSDRVTEFGFDPLYENYGHFDLTCRFLPNDAIVRITEVVRAVVADLQD